MRTGPVGGASAYSGASAPGAVNCRRTTLNSSFCPPRTASTLIFSLKLLPNIMLGICASDVSFTPSIVTMVSPGASTPSAPEPRIISAMVTMFGPVSFSFIPKLGFSLPKPSGMAGSPFFGSGLGGLGTSGLDSSSDFSLSCSRFSNSDRLSASSNLFVDVHVGSEKNESCGAADAPWQKS